jgi:hypothetical protein
MGTLPGASWTAAPPAPPASPPCATRGWQVSLSWPVWHKKDRKLYGSAQIPSASHSNEIANCSAHANTLLNWIHPRSVLLTLEWTLRCWFYSYFHFTRRGEASYISAIVRVQPCFCSSVTLLFTQSHLGTYQSTVAVKFLWYLTVLLQSSIMKQLLSGD